MIGAGELILIAVIFFFIPFIIAFISILKNEFTGNNKIVWLLAVLFVPLLGPLVYFSIGRKQRIVKADQ